MNYLKEDFEKCVINPLEDEWYERRPKLLGIGEKRLIKYAIACYDPRSPLRVEYPDWGRLKEAAAVFAGYNLDEEAEFLKGLFEGEDEIALESIHDFLRTYIRSRKWAMIVSNEETFWEYNKRLKQPIKKSATGDKDEMGAIEKKSKLAADQEVFDNRIERLYKEFFNGDETMAEAAQQTIKMNPQQIAQKLRENKSNV